MHHEDFLLTRHSMHLAIVAHTNQQASAIGVGKSRNRLRQLRSIHHFVLEILLIMLALLNQFQ